MIELEGPGGAEAVDLYGFLLRNRIIFLSQRISDTVAIQVVASLLALDSISPEEEIKMYINCPQVVGVQGAGGGRVGGAAVAVWEFSVGCGRCESHDCVWVDYVLWRERVCSCDALLPSQGSTPSPIHTPLPPPPPPSLTHLMHPTRHAGLPLRGHIHPGHDAGHPRPRGHRGLWHCGRHRHRGASVGGQGASLLHGEHPHPAAAAHGRPAGVGGCVRGGGKWCRLLAGQGLALAFPWRVPLRFPAAAGCPAPSTTHTHSPVLPRTHADECNITATELNRNMRVMYRFLSEATGLSEEQVEMECGKSPPSSARLTLVSAG